MGSAWILCFSEIYSGSMHIMTYFLLFVCEFLPSFWNCLTSYNLTAHYKTLFLIFHFSVNDYVVLGSLHVVIWVFSLLFGSSL